MQSEEPNCLAGAFVPCFPSLTWLSVSLVTHADTLSGTTANRATETDLQAMLHGLKQRRATCQSTTLTVSRRSGNHLVSRGMLGGDVLQGAAADCNSAGETHAWFDSRVAHQLSQGNYLRKS